MATPSTQWKEVIAPNEEQLFKGYLKDFEEIRKIKDAKHGKGRQLHRLSPLGLKGSLEVLSELPNYAQHGLFANPGKFDVWIRHSNGGMDPSSDRRPDIRGFAFKVLGVKGPGALGSGDTDCQDFVLINRSAFGFTKSQDFVALVHTIATKGEKALVSFFIKRLGIIGGIKKIIMMAKAMKSPFTGFATEHFYSAAPIACGPYAVRVRMQPASTDKNPEAGKSFSYAEDFKSRLAKGALKFNVQFQFFVNEQQTPIEDATEEWPESISPFITVATLSIPSQDVESQEGKDLSKSIEAAAFDPWGALMDHRPLGDVMRARKVVYFFSQQGRV